MNEIKKHLELLFLNTPGQIYTLTQAKSGLTNQMSFKTIEETSDYLEKNSDKDIWVGVASMKESSQGKKEGCLNLPCFFIEIDYKNFKDQQEFNKTKDYLFATLPPNFIVNSGGGGFHAYYKLNEPLDVQGNLEDIETILKNLAKKFKGDKQSTNVNRLLRVAGTINYKYDHKPKAHLEIFEDRVYTIEHFQEFIDEAVHYPKSEIELTELADIDSGKKINFACIKKLLSGYFDIERVNRNWATMHLAAFYKAKKTPIQDAQRIILDWALKIPKHLTSTHNPGKLKTSTESAVKSVYENKYFFNCGYSKAYGLPCSKSCELTPYTEKIESPLNLQKFLKQDIPPVQYHVKPVLPKKGSLIISGSQGSCKTFFVMNLALSIAAGCTYLEKLTTSKARVLYLTGEGGIEEVSRRLKTMTSDNLDVYIKYITGMDLLDLENKKFLKNWLNDISPHVLILDPMGQFWQGDEKDKQQVQLLTRYFDKLRREFGLSIILTHHWKKPNKEIKSGIYMASGTYWWSAWCDGHITLQGNSNSLTVSFEKVRTDKEPKSFIAKLDDNLWLKLIADFEVKYTEDTLEKLFNRFNSEVVQLSKIIETAKIEKICSKTTVYNLLQNSSLFERVPNKKGFIKRKGAPLPLFQ